jgi:hypothetical protein
MEKYLHGLKAWHLLHQEQHPESVDPRVKVLLWLLAREDAHEPPKEKKAEVQLFHLVYLAERLANGGPKKGAILDLAIVAFWGMAWLGKLTSPVVKGDLDPCTSIFTSDVGWEDN